MKFLGLLDIKEVAMPEQKLSEKDIARLDELHSYVWDHQPEFGIDPIETMWKAVNLYFKDVDSCREIPDGLKEITK